MPYYDEEGRLRSTHSQPTPGVDYTADFHTYAVEWSPGTIIFYIDNVEVHRVTDPKVSQQENLPMKQRPSPANIRWTTSGSINDYNPTMMSCLAMA